MNARRNGGRTPLHEAAQGNGNAAVLATLLLELGADVTIADDLGRTPLDYAGENQMLQGLEIVRRSYDSRRRPPARGDPRG